MTVKWKNGFDPGVILGKLAEIRTLDGDKVSFAGFEYNEYLAVLKSMVEITTDCSVEVKNRLIVKGFREAAKKKNITRENVLSGVNRALRDHLAKPDQPYWLLTTINIHQNTQLSRFNINGCLLGFYRVIPKKYREERLAVISDVSSWLIDKDEILSYYLVAHARDKSEHCAVTKMLESIDLLRGIWNFHVNKSMVLSFGGRKKPINQVTLGALHTIHNKNGGKSSGVYWYEPHHFKDHEKIDFSSKSNKTLSFTKSVRNALNRSKYRGEIEVAIIRYTRALDSQDYNAVFIKLWSLLEYVTSTLRDSYDKTIKRTVFQFADHEYHRQVLEHLRQYRNKSVHLGSDDDDIEAHVYQLKGYVERLIRFHLGNKIKFGSMKEAAEFMDLQHDREALRKQIALRKAAIEFMSI